MSSAIAQFMHAHPDVRIDMDLSDKRVDLVAEGFGIGFVAESEIGNDIRLSRIRLEGVSPSMPETLAHLSARRDVPVIRSFMRTLAKLVL